MRHGVVEGQHRNYRAGERQGDAEKVLEIAAAVNGGRLFQLAGNVLQKGAGNNHVVDADGPGDNHHPAGIDHVQLPHQDVGGDGAA